MTDIKQDFDLYEFLAQIKDQEISDGSLISHHLLKKLVELETTYRFRTTNGKGPSKQQIETLFENLINNEMDQLDQT